MLLKFTKTLIFTIFFIFVSAPTKAQKATDQVNQSSAQGRNRNEATDSNNQEQNKQKSIHERIIKDIVIHGNHFTLSEAIKSHIPYRIGETFSVHKTATLIKNIFSMKRFHNVYLDGEYIGDDHLILHIFVEEKKPLKDIVIQGNKAISTSEINQKIDTDIPALDEQELNVIAQQIKKMYIEKGYNDVAINTALKIDDDNRAIAMFDVNEGPKSLVKRIKFSGNKAITDKELRNAVFTKEDWILSFLDRSGTFIPDRLQGDKHMIEQLYQNRGYLQAKVVDIDIDKDPNTNNIDLTFEIHEGDQYHIGTVKASGNDIIPDDALTAYIPIKPGQLYSREMITNTMKLLETLWGNYGYIFSHIEPSIQPNEDTKTVDLSFESDLGKKVRLNRITIKGNKKTRDKVIRRRLGLQEGEILTNAGMDMAKNNAQSLGYFNQQDGVNWKMNRLNEELVDLDLIVKEEKTGQFNLQFGFGGSAIDLRAPIDGLNAKVSLADSNLFGSGTNVQLEGSWAKEEQTVVFHLAQPWLFDKPITAAFDVYHRRPRYDELHNLRPPTTINEKLTGVAFTGGFITPPYWHLFNDASLMGTIGVDSVRFTNLPIANFPNFPDKEQATVQFQSILNQEFINGDYVWLAFNIEQDRRNHPIYPSRGQKYKFTTRIAIPSITGNIGYGKVTMDYNWYTPLIDEFNLSLRLHSFIGFAQPLPGRHIPFGELFHVGGPTSIRGFLYSQIGPKFLGDPIGSSKAFWLNAELHFPITPDFNIMGLAFYDGGAGWSNPNVQGVSAKFLTGNNFDYRHSVGVGIRMLSPMPVRIDWGFKLDPRKGESASEIHFGMSYDW